MQVECVCQNDAPGPSPASEAKPPASLPDVSPERDYYNYTESTDAAGHLSDTEAGPSPTPNSIASVQSPQSTQSKANAQEGGGVTGGGGVVAGGFAGGALDGKLDTIARSLRTLQDVLVHRLPFVTAPAIPAAGYS